jgi:hypothetical protein
LSERFRSWIAAQSPWRRLSWASHFSIALLALLPNTSQ